MAYGAKLCDRAVNALWPCLFGSRDLIENIFLLNEKTSNKYIFYRMIKEHRNSFSTQINFYHMKIISIKICHPIKIPLVNKNMSFIK